MVTAERWPPAYDAEDLLRNVKVLLKDGAIFKKFYASIQGGPAVCQGDIVTLKTELPILDTSGQPATLEQPVERWMVAGNTCDFDRDLSDVEWTILMPLTPLADVPSEVLSMDCLLALRRVRPCRLPAHGRGPAPVTGPLTVDHGTDGALFCPM
ncbi:MAG: hypothetical protein HY904_25120 [Deltaproteobacteria bacterium]|nr:hypothetical protein [Deltaproteobacteria bacterium]